MRIRNYIKQISSRILYTNPGRRSLSRFLSESDRFILQSCDGHYVVYDPYDWIGENIWKFGNFQKKRTKQVVEYLEKVDLLDSNAASVLVEVGANIGTQTIYLLSESMFNSVIAIEPNPRSFQLLHLNLKLNDLIDSATLLPFAAGDETGSAKLYPRHFNLGASSLIPESLDCSSPYDVYVRRIDDVLGEIGVTPDQVGLFWIDVEGFEFQVLKGMGSYLAGANAIYFEYTAKSLEECQKIELADSLFNAFPDVLLHEKEGFRAIGREEFLSIRKQVDLLATGGVKRDL